MSSPLNSEWHSFNKTNVKRIAGGSSIAILALRRDGKGYYGFVNQITDEYVELANGDHRQNIYFSGPATVFALIEEPPRPIYKLAQPRLRLDDPSA